MQYAIRTLYEPQTRGLIYVSFVHNIIQMYTEVFSILVSDMSFRFIYHTFPKLAVEKTILIMGDFYSIRGFSECCRH